MILYLDTSALLKKYFKESGSIDIITLWKKADEIVTSSVAYAEAMAAMHRKKREADIQSQKFRNLLKSFQLDWVSFIRVDVTDDLNEIIDGLVSEYPLRGFDAIHLASAIVVKEKIPEDFVFACFDKQLNHAAANENLTILS